MISRNDRSSKKQTASPFLEGFTIGNQAGLLTCTILRLFFLPTRFAGSGSKKFWHLQWRDRAGFPPASLFTLKR